MQANRFLRGSGVYTCRCCGRKTRATGRGDNENSGLCAECFDLAGVDNEISDGQSTVAERANLIVTLSQIIACKGGDLSDFADLLTAVALLRLNDAVSNGAEFPDAVYKIANQINVRVEDLTAAYDAQG